MKAGVTRSVRGCDSVWERSRAAEWQAVGRSRALLGSRARRSHWWAGSRGEQALSGGCKILWGVTISWGWKDLEEQIQSGGHQGSVLGSLGLRCLLHLSSGQLAVSCKAWERVMEFKALSHTWWSWVKSPKNGRGREKGLQRAMNTKI